MEDSFMLIAIIMTLMLVLILYLYSNLQNEKLKLKFRISEYNSLVKNRNKLKEKFLYASSENERLVIKCNNLVEKLNSIESNEAHCEFSLEELQRIKFCVHPDKTGNKTTELWIKVNNLIEAKK